MCSYFFTSLLVRIALFVIISYSYHYHCYSNLNWDARSCRMFMCVSSQLIFCLYTFSHIVIIMIRWAIRNHSMDELKSIFTLCCDHIDLFHRNQYFVLPSKNDDPTQYSWEQNRIQGNNFLIRFFWLFVKLLFSQFFFRIYFSIILLQ